MTQGGTRPWYEDQPDRLQWELDLLRAKGWSFVADAAAKQRGWLILRGTLEAGDRLRELALSFPQTFPEHRVEVYDLTDGAHLPLHQEPYGRKLCLLDNVPEAWTWRESAAFMVQRALDLHAANARGGVDELRRIGVGAAEPQSTYYPYASGSSLLLPDNVLGMEGERGWFKFALESAGPAARGVVSEVRANAAKSSRCAPARLTDLYGGPSIRGVWFRLDAPPPFVASGDALLAWAASTIPQFQRFVHEQARQSHDGPKARLRLVAFVYPDSGPTGMHDAWLACLIREERRTHGWRGAGTLLLRPSILSSDEQALRIPSLAGLRGKKVMVVGLGTVGGPIALELARTGLLAQLALADQDVVSIYNLVRQPVNLLMVGLPKVTATMQQARVIAPLLAVIGLHVRLGDAPPPSVATTEREIGEQLVMAHIAESDLVIDASADVGVTRWLNRECLHRGIPFLVVSVTEGGWGGEVVRSLPGETGCYECYEWWEREGRMPAPAQDPRGEPVYTRGCGLPSFTGTGFDALSLAADATRFAVQTLQRGANSGDCYPDEPYDVLVRDNRAVSAGGAAPRYRTEHLAIHPKCTWHRHLDQTAADAA